MWVFEMELLKLSSNLGLTRIRGAWVIGQSSMGHFDRSAAISSHL